MDNLNNSTISKPSINIITLVIIAVLAIMALSIGIFIASMYLSPADPNAQPDSFEDITIRNQGVPATNST